MDNNKFQNYLSLYSYTSNSSFRIFQQKKLFWSRSRTWNNPHRWGEPQDVESRLIFLKEQLKFCPLVVFKKNIQQ